MSALSIANLLFPIRSLPEMLRDYAAHYAPVRSQEGRDEVFISGQWVGIPSDYRTLRNMLAELVEREQLRS